MNRHTGRRWMALAGLLLALAVLGLGLQPRPVAAKGLYTYDFERTLDPWTAGSGSLLTLEGPDSLCPAKQEGSMALITVPSAGPRGRAASDAISPSLAYMLAAFPVAPGDEVLVDWAAKPKGACTLGACQPVVYVGPSPTPPGAAWTAVKGTPAAFGWQDYHFAADVRSATKLVVALGVTTNRSIFGGALGVDCVQVMVRFHAP